MVTDASVPVERVGRAAQAKIVQASTKSHARTFIAAEHPSQRRCGLTR
jgi:hypothetical protein